MTATDIHARATRAVRVQFNLANGGAERLAEIQAKADKFTAERMREPIDRLREQREVALYLLSLLERAQ